MRLCLICSLAVVAAASLEDALAAASSQVASKFGRNFTLPGSTEKRLSFAPRIEALVCKNEFCKEKATETMHLLRDLLESSDV